MPDRHTGTKAQMEDAPGLKLLCRDPAPGLPPADLTAARGPCLEAQGSSRATAMLLQALASSPGREYPDPRRGPVKSFPGSPTRPLSSPNTAKTRGPLPCRAGYLPMASSPAFPGEPPHRGPH